MLNCRVPAPLLCDGDGGALDGRWVGLDDPCEYDIVLRPHSSVEGLSHGPARALGLQVVHRVDAFAPVEPIVATVATADDIDNKLSRVVIKQRLIANVAAKLFALPLVWFGVVVEGIIGNMDELGKVLHVHL